MKKYRIIGIMGLFLSVAALVVSLMRLPDTVITQFPLAGRTPTTMPKLVAVGITFLISAAGSVSTVLSREEKEATRKVMIIIVGLVVFGLLLAVNL